LRCFAVSNVDKSGRQRPNVSNHPVPDNVHALAKIAPLLFLFTRIAINLSNPAATSFAVQLKHQPALRIADLAVTQLFFNDDRSPSFAVHPLR
jgi:hypothetical protein